MSRVPHSERVRIVELCLKSYTQREIAELTGRSTNTVTRIIQAYRQIQAYRRMGEFLTPLMIVALALPAPLKTKFWSPRLMLIRLALRSSMLNLQVFHLHGVP
ncbi:hypothetical protein HPB48_017208 [Haemaphysalis longicornis]|uniref:Uncharacterized protein n=1 Tax=Haemaphysalis longicornis TaxID=44386 RepID=A0A9J6FCC8_HAELO|nr:hypothetical protein HPB48_017208 [Haemaphysalis longicornis]